MDNEIKKTYEILWRGGVILYPTDTIWGIGCDATNEEAVRRIYEIKKRSDSKSMLVLLDSSSKLNFYVNDLPDIALDLIEVSDKPLTIIYSGAKNVASGLIAEDGSLGIRITGEEFSKKLCQKLKKPLVSTSANISGQPAPANFSEINNEIIRSVDYVVNYRRTEHSLTRPSGIIKVGTGGLIQIIRK
jgi:L-threonylcarbamoyladenylate synthase